MRTSSTRASGCVVVLLVTLLAVAVARADVASWTFDPLRSDIRFELSAIGIVPIRGRFETFSGSVWRDPVDGQLRVVVRIDAGSLAMASDRYKNWARSREFFDVRRHPSIEFRSGPVPDSLITDGGALDGRLHLRGVERDVSFVVRSGCPVDSTRCELQVLGTIDRRQFGMTSRRLTLSDRVALDMRFVATPAAPQSGYAVPPSAPGDSAGRTGDQARL